MTVMGVCLIAGAISATPITISDNSTANATWAGYGSSLGKEDQEVEWNCLTGQRWDLEGMFMGTATNPDLLSMVGGWDFNGVTEGNASGDIFIALDNAPVYGGTGANGSTLGAYNYDYVIDVDWTNGTYQVFDGANVTLVTYTQNNCSNPWRRSGGGNLIATGSFVNQEGLTDAQTGFIGGTHNQVSFDLGWLTALLPQDETDVWFHFTEQCGNDNLMGFWESTPVPEPASLGLLGMGIMGVLATRIRKRT